MKNKIRIILLVFGALAGGYLVDKNMKIKFPFFTIAFPLAAGAMSWRINADMKDDDQDE
ncbi:hypothetical protein [Parvicella tangerina]|uniref:Uncharacterized protein n=1 Tax=Parvicella tangerina TaxID=2829795 RepID=A0A916JR80_9FLAO|nr:hypothetical protein [Parvicella tangerina]CAG5086990.1 hypothetical protein CRYO30217_03360 [Parvicella tangerina]